MYSSFNPRLGPFNSFIKTNPPSKRFVAVCTSTSCIYTMKALGNRSAMLFMFVIYTMASLTDACWASIITSQTWNNKNTSTSGNSKTNQKMKKEKSKFIGWFFFSSTPSTPKISSQWTGHMMIHAVHCWGTFSQRMTVDIRSTTTHTHTENQQISRLYIIPRFQSSSKGVKSKERHIQLIIYVPCVICLSSGLCLLNHTSRRVRE